MAVSNRNLPSELITEILTRAAVETILRCKAVCRLWQSLIESPLFTSLHSSRNSKHHLLISHRYDKTAYYITSILDHQYPYELIRCHRPQTDFSNFFSHIYASCDGLLYLEFYTWSQSLEYGIWNPTIREFKHLPKSPMSHLLVSTHEDIVGFGLYRNDYKVLLVSQVTSDGVYKYIKPTIGGLPTIGTIIAERNRPCFAEMYSTSGNTWRLILEVPCFWMLKSTSGAVMNESMHWLAMDKKNGSGEWSLVSFNMGDERFHESPLPVFKNVYDSHSHSLDLFSVIKEKLVALFSCFYSETIDIWVMNEYGVMGSFTRKITINQITLDRFRSLKYVGLYDDDKIIFFNREERKVVYIYDYKINKITNVIWNYSFGDICLCKESLVSVGGVKYDTDSVPSKFEIQQSSMEVSFGSLLET